YFHRLTSPVNLPWNQATVRSSHAKPLFPRVLGHEGVG
ncbi:hypothetical protein H5410_014431, partial [Solanum commersonii]